jgi:hypothetical protein
MALAQNGAAGRSLTTQHAGGVEMAARKASKRIPAASSSTLPVKASAHPPDAPAQASALRGAHAIIEGERRRLMKARSMLACLAFTMIYYREADDREVDVEVGDFADAIEVAADLLQTAIDNLDSLHLENARRS